MRVKDLRAALEHADDDLEVVFSDGAAFTPVSQTDTVRLMNRLDIGTASITQDKTWIGDDGNGEDYGTLTDDDIARDLHKPGRLFVLS